MSEDPSVRTSTFDQPARAGANGAERGRSSLASRLMRRASPEHAARAAADEAVAKRVASIDWYHTMDLPGGVTTPGFIDHRAQTHLYALPADMRGMRALDVATFDGFWAFEMERRGATVVAVDIASSGEGDLPLRWRERLPAGSDVPTGAGFAIAHEAFRSQVERRTISVYDLSPKALGTFDIVFMSDLLQHLRDPQRALERLYSMVADGGFAVVAEVYDPDLDRNNKGPVVRLRGFVDYAWSVPSSSALQLMLNVAGFSRVERVSQLELSHGGNNVSKAVFKAHPWRPAGGE